MTQPSAELQRQWNQEGYVLVEQAIAGKQLRRLQSAFDHWATVCKEDWIRDIELGQAVPTWYDIPDPFEKDDIFIDIVDHPSYYDLVMAFCSGQAVLDLCPQVRTVPCWPVSYTGWHPDRIDDGTCVVKIQLYVNDVPAEGGEFAYVPGSHRDEPQTHYRTGRNETMPGSVTYPGKAGTAILFDNRGLHTAMDNRTDEPRKSIIFGFCDRATQQPSDQVDAIAGKLTTPERRRLFGVE